LILSEQIAFDDKLTVHRGGGCTAAAEREIRIARKNYCELCDRRVITGPALIAQSN